MNAEGVSLLLLALTDDNLASLAAGLTISISPETMKEMGFPPFEVALLHGPTNEAILGELQSLSSEMRVMRNDR